LVETQVNVLLLLDATDAGLALNVSVGGAALTVTEALAWALPPAPVQESM
jgi:hypothetical protein